MTGFGSERFENDCFSIDLKIKSLNSRFLEIRNNLPMDLSYLENPLNQELRKHLKRGRVDVHLNLHLKKGGSQRINLDSELLRKYLQLAQNISNQTGCSLQTNSWDILQIKDILVVQENGNDQEVINAFLETLKTATKKLVAMRKEEGKNLKSYLLGLLKELNSNLSVFKKYQGSRPEKVKEKLLLKFEELGSSIDLDPNRLHQEIIFFLEKQDITEEIHRLESHIKQFKNLLSSKDCRGKKLDFLLQEMQREVNTIGSKSNEVAVSETIVKAKFNIEQMKEQIQNLE